MLTDQPASARSEAAVVTVTRPMPPSRISRRLDPLDHEVVLDVVIITQLGTLSRSCRPGSWSKRDNFLGPRKRPKRCYPGRLAMSTPYGVEGRPLAEPLASFLVTVPAARSSSSPAMTFRGVMNVASMESRPRLSVIFSDRRGGPNASVVAVIGIVESRSLGVGEVLVP